MKKITILSVFVLLGLACLAQNTALKLREYRPAPGQHINIENIGTPEAAQKMTENFSSLVSLGSFGGFIILEFEKTCDNHPDNPYGVDFTIFGNAFSGSSEPGVVWVMKDENQNGLPDDTWYEIAGSHHFHSKTVRNYKITYIKTETRDLLWKDNRGEIGKILANSFNLQEYYPTEQYFPQYPRDSVTFRGTLLDPEIDFSNSQVIKVKPPKFGYADSHPQKQGVDLFIPDNPFTNEIEGAGGDPIDISWAVDSLENYVNLDSIHFVKIVSSSLASAGWLGEISTDVAWVEAVKPNPEISGKENLLLVYSHPSKVLVRDSVQLEAAYFEKGRRTEVSVTFSSQNTEGLEVNAAGLVTAKSLGESEISVSVKNESETVTLKVVKPESIQVLTDFSSVYPGDTLELTAQVFDNEQDKLEIPVQYSSSNPAVGEVIEMGGQTFFVSRQAGETILTSLVEGFEVESQVTVKVLSLDDKIRIYFTLKTEDENLLPFQWIEVGASDLNNIVENRQNDYSVLEKPTLFHALTAGLQKANVPFVFRDDDAVGGKLYLYSVENDGLFYNGWGGKTEPEAFARAWTARINNEHFLNDFDKKEISNGDTVALYHVSDLTEPWIYSVLVASSDSAKAYEEIEIQLSQSECTFSEGVVLEFDFIPVANAEVFAGNVFYTDNTGKVIFILESEPPLVISSGTEAILISKKITTETDLVFKNNFHFYPNPVKNDLVIERIQNKGISEITLRFITSGGQIVFEKEINPNFQRLNLTWLPPGIYYLAIIQGKKTETHKIIKK
ncbi:T9SS type A sorting domain-containing protein [Mariniphaga sp.]|uniref:T9SS type A sorting domain-containing protein n=1 Tax=Mariniphaga sp. TaxID=1954475 RepID=UPI0035671FE0